MGNLSKILGIGALALTSLLPMKKTHAQERMNPFIQPYQTTLYYGSGDVNNDGKIDSLDLSAMKSGMKNDQADIDCDGTPSTTSDQQLLNDYLNGTKSLKWSYFTSSEKENLAMNIVKIFKTDTLKYDLENFNCLDFETQEYLYTRGFIKIKPEHHDIPDKYDKSKLGHGNIPLYGVSVDIPNTTDDHGLNAIFIGENTDDPRDFSKWLFIEPQTNKKVQVGSQSLPYNSKIGIDYLGYFLDDGFPAYRSILEFQLHGSNPELIYVDEDLVLSGIQTPVVEISNQKPDKYLLSQNYPNPFNAETTINYETLKSGNVLLELFNLRGQKLETLVNGFKDAGKYSINFNSKDLPSGTYIYRLITPSYQKAKKMTLLK